MSAHESRAAIPDVTAEQEELGLTCKTIGGLLLVLDGLISVFIPIGIRAGSYFWLEWATVQGMIGLAFAAYGVWLEHEATSGVGHVHAPPQSHT